MVFAILAADRHGQLAIELLVDVGGQRHFALAQRKSIRARSGFASERKAAARIGVRIQRMVGIAAVEDDADRRVERIGVAATTAVARRGGDGRRGVAGRDLIGIGSERIDFSFGARRRRRSRGDGLRLDLLQLGFQRLDAGLERLDPLLGRRWLGREYGSGQRRQDAQAQQGLPHGSQAWLAAGSYNITLACRRRST
jgi:hypothetical protein